MVNPERVSPPERRKGPHRLTVRSPFIEMALAGLQIDPDNMDETRRFAKSIAASVQRFQVGRLNHERGRISKSDAARMLGQALAKLRQDGAL